MVRLQVQLESAQHRQVKRRARSLGVSVSEVIRRCVDAHLDDDSQAPESRARKIMSVAGKYREPDGSREIARQHDDVLAEAYRR